MVRCDWCRLVRVLGPTYHGFGVPVGERVPLQSPCAESPITIDALSRGFDAEIWRIRVESDEIHVWRFVLVDHPIFPLYAPQKQSKDALQYR